MMDPNEELTIKEAAELSESEYITVLRAIHANKIPASKKNKLYIIKFSDLQPWIDEQRKLQGKKLEKLTNSFELINDLSKESCKLSCAPLVKPLPKIDVSDESQYFQIINSCKILPKLFTNLEILSPTCSAKPLKIEIHVHDCQNRKSYVEICNISVMGEPQLAHFNGVTDSNLRANSLFFVKEKDISGFSVFGSSCGQGLLLNLFNPFEKELYVNIIVTVIETSSKNLGFGCSNQYTMLFNSQELEPIKSKKIKIYSGRHASDRNGGFKVKQLQIFSFDKTEEFGYVNIIGASICKRGQLGYLEEDTFLNINYFSELRNVNFDTFGSDNFSGLELVLENKSDSVNNIYFALVGNSINSDLISKK